MLKIEMIKPKQTDKEEYKRKYIDIKNRINAVKVATSGILSPSYLSDTIRGLKSKLPTEVDSDKIKFRLIMSDKETGLSIDEIYESKEDYLKARKEFREKVRKKKKRVIVTDKCKVAFYKHKTLPIEFSLLQTGVKSFDNKRLKKACELKDVKEEDLEVEIFEQEPEIVEDVLPSWVQPFKKELNFKENLTYKLSSDKVHQTPGDILKLVKLKPLKNIFGDKKPDSSDNYLGIELELISKSNKEKLAVELFKEGVAEYCHIKDDGSLRGENGYGHTHEVCVLVKESMLENVVTKVCRAFEKAQCRVNKTCGMHVHLDMRARDHKLCFKNLVRSQDLLYKMQPLSRKEGTFSKRVTNEDFDEFITSPRGEGRHERYYGVNGTAYNKHKTIEIRMHSGTVDARKIINWCKILTTIVNYPKEHDLTMASPSGFKRYFKVTDDNLIDYMEERIKKFCPNETTHLDTIESN